MFTKVAQKLIYTDAWLEFFQDEILFEDGTMGTYAWMNRKSGVGVAIVTTNKKILLQKEFRYVIQQYSWEIPGGGIDEGETPLQAAVRELFEETGVNVSPDALREIGSFYPLHSVNTEHGTLFMAVIDEASTTALNSEAGEHISESKFVSFDDALAMIDSGEINDAGTANAVQLAIRKFSNG